MEKIKPFLAILQKQHFWILSTVLTLLSLASWYLTIGKLDQEYDANLSTVTGEFRKMNALKNAPNLPNDRTITGMKQQIDLRKGQVRRAWQKKYNTQDGILKWPAELTDRFINIVQPLRPIEAEVEFPPKNEPLTLPQRELYKNYIRNELPKLAAKIGSQWKPQREGLSGGRSGDPTEESGPPEIVLWDRKNQGEIETKHFSWPNSTPNTLEILYAQENLWVLDSLISIVKLINEGATAHHNASIREINSIQLGKDPQEERNKDDKSRIATILPQDIDPTQQKKKAVEPAYTPPLEGEVVDPAEARYVDKDYNPLPASTLREANDVYLKVAKRMPITMRLRMDERKVNALLVACGNAELMVEIRKVRISKNRGDLDKDLSARPDQSNSLASTIRRTPIQRNQNNPEASQGQFPFDIDVEIFGIVYIYNPPPEDDAAETTN